VSRASRGIVATKALSVAFVAGSGYRFPETGGVLTRTLLGLIGLMMAASVTSIPCADESPNSGPASNAETGAPAPPDPTAEVTSCAIGGFTIGQAVADIKNDKRFVKTTPKIYRNSSVTIYKTINSDTRYVQYIGVKSGSVVALIREFSGDEVSKIFAALNQKYGDSVAADMMPHVKSGYSLFGGSVKMENRALWKDANCGLDIEMVKQTKMVITGVGGGSGDTAAVIWTKDSSPPDGKSGVLD
jgi:hypothetical protein